MPTLRNSQERTILLTVAAASGAIRVSPPGAGQNPARRKFGASLLFEIFLMHSPALVAVCPKLRGVSVRRGLSLVEMMASLVITLIVMAATVQLFGTVTNAINFGRTGLETNDRVRSMAQRLRKDIDGLTCDTIPWQRPEAASGYLEIVKGPNTSRDALPTSSNLTTPGATLLGYTQDVLFLTSRSKDLPFIGRTNLGGTTTTVESQVAEIVWFMSQSLNSQGQPTVPPTYTLYRRVFLVRPDVNPSSQAASTYFDNNDISAHVGPDNAHGWQLTGRFMLSRKSIWPPVERTVPDIDISARTVSVRRSTLWRRCGFNERPQLRHQGLGSAGTAPF